MARVGDRVKVKVGVRERLEFVSSLWVKYTDQTSLWWPLNLTLAPAPALALTLTASLTLIFTQTLI